MSASRQFRRDMPVKRCRDCPCAALRMSIRGSASDTRLDTWRGVHACTARRTCVRCASRHCHGPFAAPRRATRAILRRWSLQPLPRKWRNWKFFELFRILSESKSEDRSREPLTEQKFSDARHVSTHFFSCTCASYAWISLTARHDARNSVNRTCAVDSIRVVHHRQRW